MSLRDNLTDCSKSFKSFPAAPTNGSPCWSSWKPGASPTNITLACGFPTPKTTWVRPIFASLQRWQSCSDLARSWSIMGGITTNAGSSYGGSKGLSISAYAVSGEDLGLQPFDSMDLVIVKLTYRSATASAERLPLTMALSRLAGHRVSVQAPATRRLAIGLRWIGRCNFVPGLSERMAPGIVRQRVDAILLSGMRRPNDLSRSGITRSRLEPG